MWNILVTSDCTLCPEALEPLKRVGHVDYRFPASREEVAAEIDRYDAVMCDAAVRLDRDMLTRATRLRIVATPSTGTDHLDKAYLQAHGIEQIDIATEYGLLEGFTATAEGTWALLLACIRRLPASFERAKRGQIGLADRRWAPWQLAGKTLGIIGCGRVGRMVARYGVAFGMKVLVYDVRAIEEPAIRQVDLDTLLTESDVISLHAHLTDQSRNLLNRQRLAQTRRGVVIVNTARGDLLDEAALVEALESGHVAACGLDVVHDEWDPKLAEHALHRYARKHDNLVLTPHVASACRESIAGARLFVADKLARRLEMASQSQQAHTGDMHVIRS